MWSTKFVMNSMRYSRLRRRPDCGRESGGLLFERRNEARKIKRNLDISKIFLLQREKTINKVLSEKINSKKKFKKLQKLRD